MSILIENKYEKSRFCCNPFDLKHVTMTSVYDVFIAHRLIDPPRLQWRCHNRIKAIELGECARNCCSRPSSAYKGTGFGYFGPMARGRERNVRGLSDKG